MHEHPQDDGQPSVDTTSRHSRNGVAYSVVGAPLSTIVRRRSGIRDSKHNSAATLAVDLASSSPWSDTILPQTTQVQENDLNHTLMSLPQVETVHHIATSDHTPREPPPQYSQYQERDLSPESGSPEADNMRHPTHRPEMSEANHPSRSFRESDYRYGADAPLLERSNQPPVDSPYPWVSNDNVEKHRRPNFRQRLVVAILFLLLTTGVVVGYSRINRHDAKAWRDLPLVQTNQTHIYHSAYDHITGCFELRERLELSTTTGDIDIQIDPQPNTDHNNTSTLILSSSTGKITLGISEKWFFREEKIFPTIHTDIKTVTGAVNARILLGSGGSAIISTVSGPQDVRVYTYSASHGDPISHLSTTSHVGDQVVALTNFGGFDATIDTLQAEHRSMGTGKIDLQYSKHWRGRVHASASLVGRVEVQGNAGLVFDQQGEHEVIAHKGKNDDLKNVDAISEGTGDIVFKSWYTW